MKLSSSKKAIFIGISGTVLQWYDFAIFGYFAPIIAMTFFPKGNHIAGMLSAFGVFAVGYLLAPIGALIFGHIGDRYGRKRALTLSILCMCIPTAIVSIVPNYQSIGLAAPIIVTLLRIIQGFVASAEFTGSAIFLVEHANSKNKALYGCLTSSAYSLGVTLAGLIASLLTASFMPAWSWRLGFAIALVAGIIIFYLRIHVAETPCYQQIKQLNKPKIPFLTAIKKSPLAFIGVIGIAWLIGVMTFGTYVFITSYLNSYFQLSLNTAIMITTLALTVDALLEPFIAILADRIGHLRVILIGVGLILFFSFPIFNLISSGNIVLIILGMTFMSILIAITFAPMNAYMIELFPETYRYSGFGSAFHIGITLFGGTTPLVLMWLVEKTGNFMAPAYYYILAAIICLGSLMICELSKNKMMISKSTMAY